METALLRQVLHTPAADLPDQSPWQKLSQPASEASSRRVIKRWAPRLQVPVSQTASSGTGPVRGSVGVSGRKPQKSARWGDGYSAASASWQAVCCASVPGENPSLRPFVAVPRFHSGHTLTHGWGSLHDAMWRWLLSSRSIRHLRMQPGAAS